LGLNLTLTVEANSLVDPFAQRRSSQRPRQIVRKGEDGKVAIRNIVLKSVDEIQAFGQNSSVDGDEVKRNDHVQKLTDKDLIRRRQSRRVKEKEIMEV
jgi:ribosome recycling factor